jgi:hypothetical protein
MGIAIKCIGCGSTQAFFQIGPSKKMPATLCDDCKPKVDPAVEKFRARFRRGQFDGAVMQAAYDVRRKLDNGKIDMRQGIRKGV